MANLDLFAKGFNPTHFGFLACCVSPAQSFLDEQIVDLNTDMHLYTNSEILVKYLGKHQTYFRSTFHIHVHVGLFS